MFSAERGKKQSDGGSLRQWISLRGVALLDVGGHVFLLNPAAALELPQMRQLVQRGLLLCLLYIVVDVFGPSM